MKGNIKKLALLTIIPLVAPFILASTVLADPPVPHAIRHAIRGQYATTGGGTCIIAHCGFDVHNVPIGVERNPGVFTLTSFSDDSVFTFEPDGTGSASGTYRLVTLFNSNPSIPWTIPSPRAGWWSVAWSFTYVGAPDGSITLNAVPDTFIKTNPDGTSTTFNGHSLWGTISPDAQTIVLNGGYPSVLTFNPATHPPSEICGSNPDQMICSTHFVLIRLNHETLPLFPPTHR